MAVQLKMIVCLVALLLVMGCGSNDKEDENVDYLGACDCQSWCSNQTSVQAEQMCELQCEATKPEGCDNARAAMKTETDQCDAEFIEIPDVTGFSALDAIQLIRESCLEVDIEFSTVDSPQPFVVFEQYPGFDEIASTGSIIVIWVSNED